MRRGGVGQLDLLKLADPANRADVLCTCTHYGIEHDVSARCQADDLLGQPCDCPGYNPQNGDE